MHLGCHAVLFRDRIKSETEDIIKGLASTGFEGSEIGSRFFGTEEKETLLSILDKYDYQLSGMHAGGPLLNWSDPDKKKEQKNSILAVARFVEDMPNKNIIMSGGVPEEEVDLKAIAEGIEEAASECLQMGVKLNYHNHDGEFENDAKVFNALVKYAPSLYFGLDLGWIYKAGFDPVEVIRQHKDRISYVHLRDMNEHKEFVNLGEGTVDYPKLMNVLKEVLGDEGWAVVEYEDGEQDFERYKKAKIFLDKL